jgi:signal transduction histidine kinase
MGRSNSRGIDGDRGQLAVRVHDAAAGLAVAIGLLKADGPDVRRIQTALDSVLVELRKVLAELVAHRTASTTVVGPFRVGVEREAGLLGIDLSLLVDGKEDLLGPAQAELVRLVAREGLRNARHHSGARSCQMSLDLSSHRFHLRVRDWGAGLQRAEKADGGLANLRRLASYLGCELRVGSRPGLGTDLTLVGSPALMWSAVQERHRTGLPVQKTQTRRHKTQRRRE